MLRSGSSGARSCWTLAAALATSLASSSAGALEARLAVDLNPGAGDGLPLVYCGGTIGGELPGRCDANFIVAGDGFLWLSGDDGASGIELWRLETDFASTSLLTDFVWPGEIDPGVVEGHRVGELLYFLGNLMDGNVELWRSDGTAAGTYPILKREPTAGSRRPSIPMELRGRHYFAATTTALGHELWVTDGTAAGAHAFLDLRPGPTSSDVDILTVFGDGLYFTFWTGAGVELWRSDGTAAGSHPITSLEGDRFLAPIDSWLLFLRGRPEPPFLRLTRSDGFSTAIDVLRETDGLRFAYSDAVATVGQQVFFRIVRAAIGSSLWRTDGTADGTWSLGPIEPATPLVAFGDHLFFVRKSSAGGELWRSDGTVAGTRLLVDLAPGSASSSPSDLVVWNGRLTFTAEDPLHGREIWTSDGTPAGTRLLADLVPGPGSPAPARLMPFGDRLLFAGDDGVRGRELWVLEGDPPAAIPALSGSGLAMLAAGLAAAATAVARRRSAGRA